MAVGLRAFSIEDQSRAGIMKIAVITLFPALIEEFTRHGILSRGIEKGLLSVSTYNPRDYTEDAHRTVDDRPYGGGPGMVMKVGPLKAAIENAVAELGESQRPLVMFLSPQGERFTQQRAREWSTGDRSLVLIAGRYEGVDERLIERYVDCEISIGDYILSGGETVSYTHLTLPTICSV